MHSIELVGYLASALVFATFYMKAMLPLRVIAIASNVAFMAYGYLGEMAPILLLHAGLLPLNVWRLWQTLRPANKLRRTGKAGLSVKFLRQRKARRRRTDRPATDAKAILRRQNVDAARSCTGLAGPRSRTDAGGPLLQTVTRWPTIDKARSHGSKARQAILSPCAGDC